ncbi:hypothetical protein [Sphingobacterium sp. UBA6320]|uniref:hypothetical protein n=1 Tax=Sphingobacterium sp. UBA6320 TaxID=1947510 RepID=UPI0025E42B17|nr:hypothetical protein [Sphingobacterium sp. UBA6320]
MDWKDKLQEIKELFPTTDKSSFKNENKEKTIKNKSHGRKDVQLAVEVLEKRLFSKVGFVCREFNITKEKLADILYLGNYHLNINNEEARITPGMYLFLSKNLRPIHYELNVDNISKILDKYLAANSKKAKKDTQKPLNKRKVTTTVKSQKKQKKARVSIIREPNVIFSKPSTLPILTYVNNVNIAADNEITKIVYVNFEDILFDDYAIRIKNGNHVSMPFYIKESRKSLFLLKKYFKKLKLAPIEVVLQGNKIKQVKNIDQLNEGIEYLKIIKYYFDNSKKSIPTSAQNLIKKLEKITNAAIKRVASLDSIEGYFDHLNDLQLTEYKIAPVVEIINTGKQGISEDTYLYSIACKSKSCLLIVWESSVQGRATYVFLSNKQDYIDTIQTIFDYISSNKRSKRLSLRQKNSDNLLDIDCIGFIKHQSFEHWKMKLQTYINEY